MDRETITTLTEYSIAERMVELTVRHDLSVEYPYHIKVGCVDEYLTETDVRQLKNMLATAERVLKSISK